VIRDNFFWVYKAALMDTGSLSEFISHWAESCPCRDAGMECPEAPCPFKGCRAPDIACGCIQFFKHSYQQQLCCNTYVCSVSLSILCAVNSCVFVV
jgi:hypothetical protein